MTSTASEQFEAGPAQLYHAPDRLTGRVVDWQVDGGAIHGVGVVDDLAIHYAPHETFLLGLTGSTPSEEQGRAFGVAMTWLTPSHVGTAPAHAGVLARISGAPTTNLMAIIVMSAGQEAEWYLDAHRPSLDRIEAGELSSSGPEPGAVWRTRLQQSCGFDLPALNLAHDAYSAALIVFHSVGLTERPKLVAAWTWARIVGSLSEALHE